jgi:hypothetical protein
MLFTFQGLRKGESGRRSRAARDTEFGLAVVHRFQRPDDLDPVLDLIEELPHVFHVEGIFCLPFAGRVAL